MITQAPRIVLYSHDGMGIGHIRRNLLIAGALAKAAPEAAILLLAGVCEASAFELPTNVDCLTLPSLCKDRDGRYQSRRLPFDRKQIIQFRSATIKGAVQAFNPDVMIVDKLPRGIGKELERTLRMIKRNGRARCILGLRDILDEPQRVQTDWLSDGNELAIKEYFDDIWIYGDQRVYDPVREYQWPDEIAQKVHYVGYLERSAAMASSIESYDADKIRAQYGIPRDAQVVLCCVGGGEDGGPLAETFAEVVFPHDHVGVVLTGPFMPHRVRARLHQAAANNRSLRVIDFVGEPAPLLKLASRAVAMGGYNSVCELLCARIPSLIVPRVSPRKEQLVRAQRFGNLGLIEVVHPELLSPAAIAGWLSRPPLARPEVTSLAFDGLDRIPSMLSELLHDGPRNRPTSTDRSTTGTHLERVGGAA